MGITEVSLTQKHREKKIKFLPKERRNLRMKGTNKHMVTYLLRLKSKSLFH